MKEITGEIDAIKRHVDRYDWDPNGKGVLLSALKEIKHRGLYSAITLLRVVRNQVWRRDEERITADKVLNVLKSVLSETVEPIDDLLHYSLFGMGDRKKFVEGIAVKTLREITERMS